MKIMLASGARAVGGAERATLATAQALILRGHRVAAVCPAAGEWNAALRAGSIQAISASIGGSLNVLAPILLSRAVKQSRPDILMVTTSDLWVWSCLTPRRFRTPRLVLVRHMELTLPPRVRRLAALRADALVAVSRGVRHSLLNGTAIAPSKVHVIPNAWRFPPRERIPGQAERVRARILMGLPPAGRWIGFLGGINLGKGICDAMAAAQAAGALGEVHLLVCGTRDERHQAPPFDQLIRTFRLNGRAHYLGHLDDVVPALTACECVVIATHSTLREGLSQTAIDAMACGTPIAAYGLSGVTEVAGENDPAAMLARPDDVRDLSGALIKLLQDPKLAENIAQRGLIRVREFDPATMASRYERLFTELIAAPPPA